MRKTIFTAALLIGGALAFQPAAYAHGGTYRGPGDTVPPGGGGGGGGGATPSSPGSGSPGAPSAPGAGSPAPGTPGSPGGGPGSPSAASTGSSDAGEDLTQWSFWWEFNKDPYINLKDAINMGGSETGTSDWFLGIGSTEQGKDSMRPSAADIQNKIVPALLEALDSETNNDIITGAMMALAKIGDSPDESGVSAFAEKFKSFLGDSNQEISETAAIALGILANEASVETLIDLYTDSADGRASVGRGEVPIRTRAFAAYGLSLVGNQITGDTGEPLKVKIVNTLVKTLESERSSTRDIHVASVVAMGLVPLQKMGDAEGEAEGGDESIDTRMEQVQYLSKYFQDSENHYMIRAHAPTAMARLLNGTASETFQDTRVEVAELLLKNLKGGKDKNVVKQSCVLALGQLGDADEKGLDKDIRKGLIGVIKNVTDQQTRFFSMIALAQAGSRQGEGSREASIDEVQKHFLSQLSRGKQGGKPWTAIAMGVFGDILQANTPKNIVNALRLELIDQKNGKVGAYAIGAGILGDSSFTEPLLKKLDTVKNPAARGYVCVALGMMGATEAIEPINDIVKGSTYKPALLQQAAIALGLLGDKNVVGDLVETLSTSKSLATQAALSSALGSIGDKRSIDPLVEMLSNDRLTSRARGFAAVALGIVADKEPLPWNSKIAVNLNYRASTQTLNDTNGTGILNIL